MHDANTSIDMVVKSGLKQANTSIFPTVVMVWAMKLERTNFENHRNTSSIEFILSHFRTSVPFWEHEVILRHRVFLRIQGWQKKKTLNTVLHLVCVTFGQIFPFVNSRHQVIEQNVLAVTPCKFLSYTYTHERTLIRHKVVVSR